MNFREVNKKLNELKQSDNKQVLEQFRNTKISEIISNNSLYLFLNSYTISSYQTNLVE